MKKTLLAALALATMAVLAAAPARAQVPPDIDLTASTWSVLDGPNNTMVLYNDAGGDLYFDFPVMPNTSCVTAQGSSCDTMNYLHSTHIPTTVLTGKMLVITLKVETTGTPAFHHTEYQSPCSTLPNVRAFFWKGTSLQDGDRWWSIDGTYVLGPGTVTLNIPIDPAHWSGVKGQIANESNKARHQWSDAVNSVTSIGVTFGGGCNAGHGVFVTDGTARFTLMNYEVRPVSACPSVASCNLPCQSGSETGTINTLSNVCLYPDGSFLNCDNQSLVIVQNACTKPACCKPPCITCPATCSGGQHLECR